ncbi:MAG: chemotaxis protein CheX [Phycisphaera sp.]|nr:MAG: chemotaxis protein CheX [Phycisphaera sp.]
MNDLNTERLGKLAIEALERTAFVVAEPADEDFLDELPECDWHTKIEYSGPESGTVILSGSSGFLVELASSLLGVCAEDVRTDGEGLDALREMTNIVGGSVVTVLGGAHCKLSLGLPEVVDSSAVSDGSTCVHCILDAEGERLDIYWIPKTESSSRAA